MVVIAMRHPRLRAVSDGVIEHVAQARAFVEENIVKA